MKHVGDHWKPKMLIFLALIQSEKDRKTPSRIRSHLHSGCNILSVTALYWPPNLRHNSAVTLVVVTWHIFTYLLTPWCSVLLEKLSGLQLVKKFPAFHGTRRFITALTSVRHLSLSLASPVQSIYPHPTSWRSVLILSTHLRLGLPSGFLPSGLPTKTLYTPLSSPI